MASIDGHHHEVDVSGPSIVTRYEASMILGAVGDAMGFRNARWEFNYSGRDIHNELKQLGGLESLTISPEDGFRLSDDSILHLSTAEGLVSEWTDKETLFHNVAQKYKDGCQDMLGRSPGGTTLDGVDQLRPHSVPNGYRIGFNRTGGGCGAAMRACPIGLYFPEPEQVVDLVEVAIETGRMTHHHPTGYLGSLAAALFVSYAIQKKPPKSWGAGLIDTLVIAKKYIEDKNIAVGDNLDAWDYFEHAWLSYLEQRGILDGKSDPKFPTSYNVDERDAFYSDISWSGWGGSSGHDATIIAYDAVLGAGDSWEELCLRGMLHGGDNDSTGIIAGAAWGAMYGYEGVPPTHYSDLEYRDRINAVSAKLFRKAHGIGSEKEAL